MVSKSKKALVALLVAVLISIFFLNETDVHAVSCGVPRSFFIVAYERNTFVDGFFVQQVPTESWCGARPVVIERSENLQNILNLQNIFLEALIVIPEYLDQTVFSGVYQFFGHCRMDSLNERCVRNASFTQLSKDPAELTRYKSEWQQKEQDGLRSATVEKWLVTAVIMAIVTLALLWPWILVKIRPNLRKQLSSLLIIAIFLQVPLAYVLWVMFIWTDGLFSRLWEATASISLIVLGLSILAEIVLIVRKIRSRNIGV